MVRSLLLLVRYRNRVAIPLLKSKLRHQKKEDFYDYKL